MLCCPRENTEIPMNMFYPPLLKRTSIFLYFSLNKKGLVNRKMGATFKERRVLSLQLHWTPHAISPCYLKGNIVWGASPVDSQRPENDRTPLNKPLDMIGQPLKRPLKMIGRPLKRPLKNQKDCFYCRHGRTHKDPWGCQKDIAV